MTYANRTVCAVPICNSDLKWESDTNEKDVTNQFLRENGWQLAFGKWICPSHETTIDKDPAVAKAEEFAKVIRRASRTHGQNGEGRAIQNAIYYLRSLKGSPVEEAANEAYNAVLRRKYAWDDPIA